MPAFFSVTNYDQQQHYKDRGPTWIKLYNRLLDDYGFAQLPDAAKWHLIGIFLLASRHANRIPADPAWLARQVSACDAIDLGVLERSGFIAPISEHKEKVVPGFTRRHGVEILVWYEEHGDINGAIVREKQIKGWNRAWKLKLIEKDNSGWNDLALGLV